MVLIVTILVWPNGKGGSDIKPTDNQTQQALQSLTIDVPNAANAYIVFPDGSKKELPYDITGKEGENFQFTLEADGYEPKKVEVPISVSRKSYDYNLEKIKE